MGGTRVASVPVGAGGSGFTMLPTGNLCQSAGLPVVAASGTWILVNLSTCLSGSGGWGAYDLPHTDSSGDTTLVPGGNGLSIASRKPALLGDDGLVFVGHQGSDGDGIMVADLATGEYATWIAADDGSSIEAVTISPDLSWMVACQNTGGANDLFLISSDGASPVQLTNDGKSCHPAW